jgi:predicted ABC-type ATPase
VETNLANNSFAQRIPKWRELGYRISVYYLWIPSPDLAVARVAQRVLSGGHDIPESTIRRRYYRGLSNFFQVYAPLANRWHLYDSSTPGKPRLIESGVRKVSDFTLWEQIREIAFNEAGKE